jgi:error-prone DNA polymerase
VDAFAKDHHWFDDQLAAHRLSELAHSVGAPAPPALMQLWLELTRQIKGAPRHLSQHVGGFVLTETPLHRLVPVEPAAMTRDDDWADTLGVLPHEPEPQHDGGDAPATSANGLDADVCTPAPEPSPLDPWLPASSALRQVIQWEKDDLEALGMLKVDVLALGMLTAVRRCIDLVASRRGTKFTRYDIQSEDPATYRMICAADTVGVFQIESRAQMSMLPRLAPRTFYDLVVQVAIVRPGPIQGGMVHPYLHARARQRRLVRAGHHGPFPLEYPQLANALERTLGVPIFQEQVMQIAIDGAGFTPGEADDLRRSMAAWKRKGGVHRFEDKFKQGLLARGYPQAFADQLFQQILIGGITVFGINRGFEQARFQAHFHRRATDAEAEQRESVVRQSQ